MKTYHGIRTPQGCEVWVSEDNKPRRPLPLRLDLRDHSPTGFEWGYGGSGPAQLALALLADALGDDEAALREYQTFKAEVIAVLPRQWTMTDADIRQFIEH